MDNFTRKSLRRKMKKIDKHIKWANKHRKNFIERVKELIEKWI